MTPGVRSQPQKADAFFQQGLSLARQGRWYEALEAYQQSLRANPNNPETHLNIGFVYYEMGYDQKAQQAFERAKRLQARRLSRSLIMTRSNSNSIETIQKTLDLAGQELRILHTISQSISCTLDLDRVIGQIIDLVIDVTHGDSCLVYLLDESGEHLVLRGSKNPHPRLIGKIELKVGEGITGWVAQEAQPVAIARHASKDSRFKVFQTLPEDKYEAFLSVPIVAPPTDRVIGVINVQHRRAHKHSDAEKTLLSIIGHQVGGAIENARLYQETAW